MQTLARLVLPPAEQSRPPATAPRGPQSRDLAAGAEGGRRRDGGAERTLVKADKADLDRLAPRGTYLNIVV